MGSNSKTAWNAAGRDELLWFMPETLTIVDDPDSPLYDPDRLSDEPDENLIRNIMVHGVKVAIVVRRNGKTKDGVPIVEVVDGRQRVRCAREANKRLLREGAEPVRVSATIHRGDAADATATMVLTNELRRDDTPLAKAKKALRLAGMGKSEDEIATIFGVTKKRVKDWLVLVDCDDKVQVAVEKGEVSADVAIKMSGKSREEQRELLAELVAEGATKGRKAKEAIANKSSKSNGHAEADGDAIELPKKRQLRKLLEALDGGSDAAKVLAFVLDGKPLKGEIRKVWEKATAVAEVEA